MWQNELNSNQARSIPEQTVFQNALRRQNNCRLLLISKQVLDPFLIYKRASSRLLTPRWNIVDIHNKSYLD
jgi:hypothetical protein